MAIVAMTNAVPGAVASSTEYNKLISNIVDIDARLGGVVSANPANTRLGALETLTTDTSTNGGQGNAQLANRLGTGVGTTTNVTTGTATAQLTDLRSRVSTVETRTLDATTGNTALGTRVTTAQAKADLAYTAAMTATKYNKSTAGTTVNSTTEQVAMSQSISVTSATNSVAIIANCDISLDSGETNVQVSGAGCLVVKCYMDGVVQSPQIIFGGPTKVRLTAGQTWTFSNLSVGSHTVELRGVLAGTVASNPSYTIQQTHTGFTAIVSNK